MFNIGDTVKANGHIGTVTATAANHTLGNYVPEGMICVRLNGGEIITAECDAELASYPAPKRRKARRVA